MCVWFCISTGSWRREASNISSRFALSELTVNAMEQIPTKIINFRASTRPSGKERIDTPLFSILVEFEFRMLAIPINLGWCRTLSIWWNNFPLGRDTLPTFSRRTRLAFNFDKSTSNEFIFLIRDSRLDIVIRQVESYRATIRWSTH